MRLTKRAFAEIVKKELPHLAVEFEEKTTKGRKVAGHARVRYSYGSTYNEVTVSNPAEKEHPTWSEDYFCWDDWHKAEDAIKFLKEHRVDVKKYDLES